MKQSALAQTALVKFATPGLCNCRQHEFGLVIRQPNAAALDDCQERQTRQGGCPRRQDQKGRLRGCDEPSSPKLETLPSLRQIASIIRRTSYKGKSDVGA